jgi:hypothetical protein
MQDPNAVYLAKEIHEIHQRVGVECGRFPPDYQPIPWPDMPENYRRTLVCTCEELFARRVLRRT